MFHIHFFILFIIKVFIKRKILPGQTNLSAYAHARADTHTHTHTHTSILTIQNLIYTHLKTGSKQT